MKLRNKKTGEIKAVNKGVALIHYSDGTTIGYNSLAELNEEWEDYKKPEEYWFISTTGKAHRFEGEDKTYTPDRKQLGNYFETKEEAERVVEKLKAWKRLKDKGVKIIYYDCYGGTSTKGEFLGEVKVTIDVPQDVDKYLFKLLLEVENDL